MEWLGFASMVFVGLLVFELIGLWWLVLSEFSPKTSRELSDDDHQELTRYLRSGSIVGIGLSLIGLGFNLGGWVDFTTGLMQLMAAAAFAILFFSIKGKTVIPEAMWREKRYLGFASIFTVLAFLFLLTATLVG